MEIVCLDLEGVLVPEIWINFAKKTGIKELEATKLYLEQEVAVYKSILDEIKSLLKNNETVKK